METVAVNFDHSTCRRRYVTMIFDFVYINAPKYLLGYPECNQISNWGNGTPVREIEAQTHLDHVQPHVTMKVVGGGVGMGDIRKHHFSRAGAFPGKGNFHQNIIIIIVFTLIITITY